jgi:hypothetical protein
MNHGLAHGVHTQKVPPRGLGDGAALLLSGLCLAHCLVLPLVISLLPWLTVLVERDSVVHCWLLLAIVPISLLALTRGCIRHHQWRVLWLGAAALSILATAGRFAVAAEWMESSLTVLGSAILSTSHLFNLRALRHRPEGRPA